MNTHIYMKYIQHHYDAFIRTYPSNVYEQMDNMSEEEVNEWMYQYLEKDPVGRLVCFVNLSLERWIWRRQTTYDERYFLDKIHDALYVFHMTAKQTGMTLDECERDLPRMLSLYGCNLYKVYGTWADVTFTNWSKRVKEEKNNVDGELPF